MRRADRLLQIVQVLRRATAPMTAAAIADELEVGRRTIYRDMVALQASRVPVDGEAGVGYVLRPGYDLPPLMFDAAEIEAVVLGLGLVAGRGDEELADGARDALAKIKAVLPPHRIDPFLKAALLVPHALEPGVGFGPHLPEIRRAIRSGRKLRIAYKDGGKVSTERTVWPLGLYLYSHVTLVCTWCEQRNDFRAFRSERIGRCDTLDERFDGQNGALMRQFVERFTSNRSAARSSSGGTGAVVRRI